MTEYKKIKLRLTAKQRIERRFAVVFMGEKLAVAFDRDSGARVAYGSARLIDGKIGSGGSRANWYCYVAEGSIFEVAVDEEFYRRNKNRIKNWDMQEIEDFSETKERNQEKMKMEVNLE